MVSCSCRSVRMGVGGSPQVAQKQALETHVRGLTNLSAHRCGVVPLTRARQNPPGTLCSRDVAGYASLAPHGQSDTRRGQGRQRWRDDVLRPRPPHFLWFQPPDGMVGLTQLRKITVCQQDLLRVSRAGKGEDPVLMDRRRESGAERTGRAWPARVGHSRRSVSSWSFGQPPRRLWAVRPHGRGSFSY